MDAVPVFDNFLFFIVPSWAYSSGELVLFHSSRSALVQPGVSTQQEINRTTGDRGRRPGGARPRVPRSGHQGDDFVY